MREIKFSYIWQHDETGSIIDNRHTLEEIEGGDHYDAMSDNPMLKRYRLVARREYTGIKDRNGVEIYEGDIVTGEYDNLSVDYTKKGAVEMGYTHDSDGWANGCTYGWVATTGSSLADLDETEVIGNIYDNPELLEEDNE